MFEHAIYSVISPEGASSILWHTAEKAPDAAEAMKITAADQLKLGIADRVVPEPVGGAQRDPAAAIASLGAAIAEELLALADESRATLIASRRDKFLRIA
jgi:acetyl-CoA carboxylase carboxyl transferase subunit alpha